MIARPRYPFVFMNLTGKQIESADISKQLILLKFTDGTSMQVQVSSRWTDTPVSGDRLVFWMETTYKSETECP